MRESIYLFKSGFKPIWEDRRNINGGSWTFRMPKSTGPDVWTRVQLLAIGEKLQSVLDEGTSDVVSSTSRETLPHLLFRFAQPPGYIKTGRYVWFHGAHTFLVRGF